MSLHLHCSHLTLKVVWSQLDIVQAYYIFRPFRHDCFRTDTQGVPFSSSITQAGHMMQKMLLCLAAVNHLPDRRVVRRFGKMVDVVGKESAISILRFFLGVDTSKENMFPTPAFLMASYTCFRWFKSSRKYWPPRNALVVLRKRRCKQASWPRYSFRHC